METNRLVPARTAGRCLDYRHWRGFSSQQHKVTRHGRDGTLRSRLTKDGKLDSMLDFAS